jgi:tol-pal system protein YbgF
MCGVKLDRRAVLLWIFLSTGALAESTVVDMSSLSHDADLVTTTTADKQRWDQYHQIKVLQGEVRVLRGMLEEVNHELQRLKQRQKDDYLDIDRRLSATNLGYEDKNIGIGPLKGQVGVPSMDLAIINASPSSATYNDSENVAVNGIGLTDAELVKIDYQAASDQLLKQRDIAAATQAFKQHITLYPSSPYLANAYYWLGEIYLLQGHNEESRQAFTIVMEQYPDHRKAMDAVFKLGKIHHQLGDTDYAQQLLKMALQQGESGTSAKAQAYLNRHF